MGVALFAVTLSADAGPLAATVPAPSIDAKSYILTDFQTGAVLAEKNADERVEPASLTKIMTVYAASHALKEGLIHLDDQVTVSKKAWKMEGSRMFLEVGKQVSVDMLLNGIVIQSGNDASVALAEHVSGSEEVFVGLMNKHAKALGMTNTSFSDATGLPDPNNYTTARDMAKLSAALIREFPEEYKRSAVKEFTFNGIRQHNRNRMLTRDPTVDGIKTGHTESAGFCLISSAQREGMRVISAVMGTASDDARTEASYALINYGYRFFETKQLYEAKQVVASPEVWGGATETVAVGSLKPVWATLPRGRFKDVKAVAKLEEPIKAPLTMGQPLGHMTLNLDEQEVAEIPLVALAEVPEGSLFSRLYDDLRLMLK
ncbi:MAG: D-alanyl-D-alanine carboxypeptidase [Gammaproteobacteria bacterium]|nr:D-alanyl-D-alanine carboxypeptidase [Gammaproteobacteria bacterium]